MGDKDFMLAGDGWVQVTPCGEFPHVGAGVTQVIDREACDRIAADFNRRKSDANFPGVLVDFDHFSLDTEKSSEAAGWISDLESRDTGLWARVRWSDAGLSAVRGGRFRLMSPVFPPPSACEDLGGGKIRPFMLVSVALTNEPNIKGGKPIANRKTEVRGQRSEDGGEAYATKCSAFLLQLLLLGLILWPFARRCHFHDLRIKPAEHLHEIRLLSQDVTTSQLQSIQ